MNRGEPQMIAKTKTMTTPPVEAIGERLQSVLLRLDHECRRLAELASILSLDRPNVLVIGPATDADWAFELMRPYWRSPMAFWSPRETGTLPTTPCCTLVIQGVDA